MEQNKLLRQEVFNLRSQVVSMSQIRTASLSAVRVAPAAELPQDSLSQLKADQQAIAAAAYAQQLAVRLMPPRFQQLPTAAGAAPAPQLGMQPMQQCGMQPPQLQLFQGMPQVAAAAPQMPQVQMQMQMQMQMQLPPQPQPHPQLDAGAGALPQLDPLAAAGSARRSKCRPSVMVHSFL